MSSNTYISMYAYSKIFFVGNSSLNHSGKHVSVSKVVILLNSEYLMIMAEKRESVFCDYSGRICLELMHVVFIFLCNIFLIVLYI
jgi:hypothetical protein